MEVWRLEVWGLEYALVLPSVARQCSTPFLSNVCSLLFSNFKTFSLWMMTEKRLPDVCPLFTYTCVCACMLLCVYRFQVGVHRAISSYTYLSLHEHVPFNQKRRCIQTHTHSRTHACMCCETYRVIPGHRNCRLKF